MVGILRMSGSPAGQFEIGADGAGLTTWSSRARTDLPAVVQGAHVKVCLNAVAWSDSKRLTPFGKLHNVQTTLSTLNLRDEGLGIA
jgi:hypothetical protein